MLSVDLDSRLLQRQPVSLLVRSEKTQQLIKGKQFSEKQASDFLLISTLLTLWGTVSGPPWTITALGSSHLVLRTQAKACELSPWHLNGVAPENKYLGLWVPLCSSTEPQILSNEDTIYFYPTEVPMWAHSLFWLWECAIGRIRWFLIFHKNNICLVAYFILHNYFM